MIEYLSREDQEKLRGVLNEVPELVENLAAAIVKPYEAIDYQPRVSTGEKTQPLPYDPSAEDAAKYLQAELWRWTVWLHEERGIDLPNAEIAPMARWIGNHITILATTPGAEPAYANISSEIKAAQRTTRRPTRQPIYVDQISKVRDQELNASGIAAIAREIGETGLTRKRVNNLNTHGHITPTRMYGRIPIYRLGDVLDAHNNIEQRRMEA